MPPTRYASFEFNQRRQNEKWERVNQLTELKEFSDFVNNSQNRAYTEFGQYAMNGVKQFSPEVEAEVANSGTFMIYLDLGAKQNFVSVFKMREDQVLVWPCWKSQQDERDQALDGAGCLRKLGDLAVGDRPDVRVQLPEQEDKAFMWKAPSVHPLQVLENTYQRVVNQAVKKAVDDPLKVQSETLSRFFVMDAAVPERLEFKPVEPHIGEHLSTVRMNHLIDTFYLFRLLVHYRIESGEEMSEDLRADLSSSLTKLLHNGDPAKMSWLSKWLTKKMGELGNKISKLNTSSQPRVIFFVKGGRALNYFLGTPEKGENDWDTQVVIDPSLPAEDWYALFAKVHDTLLATLETFKSEFTGLVQESSAPFAEYLKAAAQGGVKACEDEEVDENDASDDSSQCEPGARANCKAELIDIGIPRRDSPSALEEWTRLSAPGALLQSDGVVYPHRKYYIDEYLMMIRQAFLPNADVTKAPKRIKRLGLLLQSQRGKENGLSAIDRKRVQALPKTASAIAQLADKSRQELFGVVISQFVEAYNLLEDKGLAPFFDDECVALIAKPHDLLAGLAQLLDSAQKATATDVGIAHDLSTRMDLHWAKRNDFFIEQTQCFTSLVKELSELMNPGLQKVQAQFAIAGSYAARLHADHLRQKPLGLEPIRRILVKLQCAHGRNRDQVMSAVRDTIIKLATDKYKLTVELVTQPNKPSLLLHWGSQVTIGTYAYKPLVMKIRVAEQTGNELPVLASIDGLPVLDLRYLVADYRKKTSKVDETGARRVLASATAAVSEMLSRFDFDSDSDDSA